MKGLSLYYHGLCKWPVCTQLYLFFSRQIFYLTMILKIQVVNSCGVLFNGGNNSIIKYYPGHKFLSINFPSKRRGRSRRAGEGGTYEFKLHLAIHPSTSCQHNGYPSMQFVQNEQMIFFISFEYKGYSMMPSNCLIPKEFFRHLFNTNCVCKCS